MKKLLRRVRVGSMDTAVVLFALWLIGCTAFQFRAATVLQIQCLTAPIQWIAAKGPDGCNPKGVQLRHPVPGERGFIQCHCSEKKFAQSAPKMGPRREPFFVARIDQCVSEPRPAPPRISGNDINFGSENCPPRLRPPPTG